MNSKACVHQYCPADHCTEQEDLRACRHRDCPDFRCLKKPEPAKQPATPTTY